MTLVKTMTYEPENMDMDEDVSEDQLTQLDDLLDSFKNLNKCADTKVNGDDALMIESVKDASDCVTNKNSSYLNSITHIKSSY